MDNLEISVDLIRELRANSALPEETGRMIDRTVQRVGMERMVLVRDLIEAGLVREITNPQAVLDVRSQAADHKGVASQTMEINPDAQGSQADYDPRRWPLYATYHPFRLPSRTVAASDADGMDVAQDNVAGATRTVNEGIEIAGLRGLPHNVAGVSYKGIEDTTNNLVISTNWDTASGSQIFSDVMDLVDLCHSAKRYENFYLYVGTTWGNKLQEDYKPESDKTILERLEGIKSGDTNLTVRIADFMSPNTVCLVPMVSDCIDVLFGQGPVPVWWTESGGFVSKALVIAFIAVRVKQDHDGTYGIAKGSI